MDSQFNDIEVFQGKSLSDVFKDIYDNHINKKTQIANLISDLTPLIEGIGDATLLVPLIKEYMDLGIKNDEQLVKLAQIVQRLDSAGQKKASDTFNFGDLEGLLAEDKSLTDNLQTVENKSSDQVNSLLKN